MPQDWNNIDLERPYERDSNIVEPYSFETLLLEIHCNIKDITPGTVGKQFEESLAANMGEARSIFKANLDNIVKQAQKERAKK